LENKEENISAPEMERETCAEMPSMIEHEAET